MKKKINIGILGCSGVARKHAISALKKISFVGDIFISSRSSEKAKEWAKEFGIKSKNSYMEILNDSEIDAVYISLPVKFHEEWALKCAENKKHVICEKTISYNLSSVRKMVDRFSKNGLVLFENFVCDYHPQHQKISSLIENGKIGVPMVFKSYFGFDVPEGNIRLDKDLLTGCFNDVGAYIVFMSRKIFREEPRSVVANFDEIHGTVYMEFPNDKRVFGAFGFKNAYQNNYSIWGSQGLISTERAYRILPQERPKISLLKTNGKKDVLKHIEMRPANQFELIFRDFFNTIVEKKQQNRVNKYKSILSQAKIMQALRLSNKSGKKIFLKN